MPDDASPSLLSIRKFVQRQSLVQDHRYIYGPSETNRNMVSQEQFARFPVWFKRPASACKSGVIFCAFILVFGLMNWICKCLCFDRDNLDILAYLSYLSFLKATKQALFLIQIVH
jgi:hypothetical protein